MIRRYSFGTPYDTGAVMEQLPVESGKLPYFGLRTEGDRVTFRIAMDADEILLGLGETVRGINKRGYVFRSWNSDIFDHNETQSSLYASQNLLIFFSEKRLFAIYLDDPGLVTWDLGYTQTDTAEITSENGDLDVYLIEEEDLTATVKAFRKLIGKSYIPPRWAFGYIQSRWGYAADAEIRTVANEHRKRGIPLDGICMDIDYMEGYKDFTWNRENFPDLKRLCEDMAAEHIRLVPIIDAGIKLEPGDPVYDSGLEGDCFCRKENGDLFVGAVWPGRSCFPDFLNADARAWFGKQYKALLDEGIEGFWNDMNEPAIFYSDETLAEAYATVDALRHTDIGLDGSFKMKDAFNRVANHPDDYRRFWHRFGDRTVRHDKVHNLYGAMMTRAAGEYFSQYAPDRRKLLFSRSSFVGAHRYGGVWQGDNFSWWSHIGMCMRMLPAMNMCGFLYSGCDVGGFGCNVTEDLLLRWLQFSAFVPLMRNHSALGTREQEVYRFSLWPKMRDVIQVRYAMIPYLYSEFVKAAETDACLFRPLAFDWPEDPRARRVEDQLMLGGECMIAPVTEQNARGRYVYLPEDMMLIRFRSPWDYDTEILEKGNHWVDLDLHEFPLFIRKGKVIPFATKPVVCTDELKREDLTLIGWTEVGGEYRLYWDDGVSPVTDVEKNCTVMK